MERTIKHTSDETQCRRPALEFSKYQGTSDGKALTPMIRLYGGNACAVLQLRGYFRHKNGKQVPMYATASYLDAKECDALIAKLTMIRATLYTGNL